MTRGRVLLITGDEWEVVTLTKFLTDAGFEVSSASTAREGFDKVRAIEPDCILCDAMLPDIDGFWVAKRVRTEPSRIATTPFLFLTDAGDADARLQGLHVGADLYLSRPLRADEVVAQVGALIDMANRLRQQRDSFSHEAPASTRDSPASRNGQPVVFEGDVAQISLSTVLTLLELERRSGKLKVKGADGRRAELGIAEGRVANASIEGAMAEPTAFIREVLRWKTGKFSFKADAATARAEHGEDITLGGLLLEAMRLEDEGAR
jgi:DNA-binding response OmpR family regulator